MPAMMGLELVIKARQACPEPAVLIATGYAELPKGDGSAIPSRSSDGKALSRIR
jgi:hypothetical protein